MAEDQPQVGQRLGDPRQVAGDRPHAVPGVDEHRQPIRRRLRQQLLDGR
ncbi:hypothetical protein [Phytohabitans rumicis]|nr:hypothetical protein [Phytohabitans rumicis]